MSTLTSHRRVIDEAGPTNRETAGEADDILAQLPRDLKEIWEAA